mgnify:CR=1 FL=1
MRFRYRASTTNQFLVATSSISPFFIISGSATRTRIVRRVEISGYIATAALGAIHVAARKFSVVPTGGTATTLTRVPLDSAFPAAATDGLVQVYTGSPDGGTSLGTLKLHRAMAKHSTIADGAPVSEATILFDFSPRRKRAHVVPPGIYLHGTDQALVLVLAVGITVTLSMSIVVEWDEEAGP